MSSTLSPSAGYGKAHNGDAHRLHRAEQLEKRLCLLAEMDTGATPTITEKSTICSISRWTIEARGFCGMSATTCSGIPVKPPEVMGVNEAARMVGILAIDQTELLDDLPVIRTATGKIKIATTDLANSADLVEDAKARVEKVTMSLQKAEKLVVKTIGLIAQV